MKKFLAKLDSYKIHIRSWLLFIPIEITVVGLASGVFGSPGIYIVHYALNIALFYLCGDLIYPLVFKKRIVWIWKLPLSLLAIYSCYLFVNYFVDYYINKHTSWLLFDKIIFNSRYAFGVLWRALQFMGFSAFYYLFKAYNRAILTKAQLEQDRYNSMLTQKETEVKLSYATNAYLKAQINPHLLFNTLSAIYTDIYMSSPRSAEAVMTLSEVMRFSIDCENTDELITLGEEIDQVENLIKLHQTRFEDELNIQFTYEDELRAVKFIPLILLTVAENLFKHGLHTDQNIPATLSLKLIEDTLTITSRNLINQNKKKTGFGKGLENIRQRISLIYAKDAQFDVQSDEKFFRLTINVKGVEVEK
ncbi:sensor histidine kinase [Pedobacter sp. Leaf194]|uniref:sensor histidine kinase n=1 Tax=Pedobacter sp. Leaf194 TaxID=1736297 RepID=UPI00138F30BB|nr:histidine kinase [Pedobacter sp. Leaf194]